MSIRRAFVNYPVKLFFLRVGVEFLDHQIDYLVSGDLTDAVPLRFGGGAELIEGFIVIFDQSHTAFEQHPENRTAK